MKYVLGILFLITLIVAIIIATMQFSSFAKNQAIDGCFQTARITEQKDGSTVTTPENYWYNFCLKEKGLK